MNSVKFLAKRASRLHQQLHMIQMRQHSQLTGKIKNGRSYVMVNNVAMITRHYIAWSGQWPVSHPYRSSVGFFYFFVLIISYNCNRVNVIRSQRFGCAVHTSKDILCISDEPTKKINKQKEKKKQIVFECHMLNAERFENIEIELSATWNIYVNVMCLRTQIREKRRRKRER